MACDERRKAMIELHKKQSIHVHINGVPKVLLGDVRIRYREGVLKECSAKIGKDRIDVYLGTPGRLWFAAKAMEEEAVW